MIIVRIYPEKSKDFNVVDLLRITSADQIKYDHANPRGPWDISFGERQAAVWFQQLTAACGWHTEILE